MTAEPTLVSTISEATQQSHSDDILNTASSSSTTKGAILPQTSSNISINTLSTGRKRSAADFQFLECIGEGSYSKVYRAISRRNVNTYAIKILNKQHIHKEKKRKYVTIEKNTLNVLGKHPGIVTLYYTFQDPKSLYFVIDFAENGELLNLIHKLGSLSVELSQYYAIQLIDTIKFIHKKGIIHRDLKPENILLNNYWKLMITDFGAAKILDENDNPKDIDNSEDLNEGTGSFVGTAEYIPPELLKYNQSGYESDFWALGCIIYQMIVGKPPFKAATEYETFERIVDVNYSFPDPQKYPIPSSIIDIVKQLLCENPEERLGLDRIQLHPWFKDINWDDKEKMWGPVPKLEPYKPEQYFKLKRTRTQPQTQQQTIEKIVKPFTVQESPKKKLMDYTMHSTTGKRIDVDYENDKPRTVLKKQIINAQSNTQLMNKVLNNRINEKNTMITNKLMDSSPTKRQRPLTSPSPENFPNFDPTSTIQVSKKRDDVKTNLKSASNKQGNKINNLNSNSNSNRNSTNSTNSVISPIDSSAQVPVNSKPTNTTTNSVPSPTVNKSNKIGKLNPSSKFHTSNKILYKQTPPIKSAAAASAAVNVNNSHIINTSSKQATSPKISSNQNVPFLIQRPRVASSDAAAAAGAIGTLLTHKRHINATSSTSTQYKQLHQHQKQLINPVLLDRQIPNIITSKLMQHETILKLDNIFKSEINHKSHQFIAPGETFNHSTLQNVIQKYDRDLEKDLKSCIMVITSNARVFIYELNDGFKLHNPQSSTQMQALDFYSKITEIKLTNKNVSLYDYEFDEEIHEGYLILELANVNKLIFLSAWDRGRFVKGGLNSNVRVGFHVNENESWVKSFLKAKNLLKKKNVLATQNVKSFNNNSKLDLPRLSNRASQNFKKEEEKVSGSVSTSGMHQSFRKLKLNTHSRIRSFSQSSGKGNSNSAQSPISKSPSIQTLTSMTAANIDQRSNTVDGRDSSSNSSLLNGVKELAIGVRSSFRNKESNRDYERRVRSDSDTGKGFNSNFDDISDAYSNDSNNTSNNSDVIQASNSSIAPSAGSTGTVRIRDFNSNGAKGKTLNMPKRRQESTNKNNDNIQNKELGYKQNTESKAAIAAALAVGKKQ